MNRDEFQVIEELEEYSKKQALYEILAYYSAKFLSWRIKKEFGKIPWPLIHTEQSRAKSLQSLGKRLKNKKIIDFRDLAGARVIFHFKDDLETLCDDRRESISNWFGIEAKESFEKKIDPGSDVFGYDSYHFVFRVTPGTQFFGALRKYDQERFLGMWCEIQLRTILQHAWAEAEHELLYKRDPNFGFSNIKERKEKRKWVMHAASIESLDEQFVRRKIDLEKKSSVTQDEKSYRIDEELNTVEGSIAIGGKNYKYLKLHSGNPEGLTIEDQWTLYNINELSKYSKYKSFVWSKLVSNHRIFMDNLQSYDTPLVRIVDFEEDNNKIVVQPAVYSDQIVTNHTICHDIKIPEFNKTIKELNLDSNGRVLELEESILSNTVGVSCVIRTVDDRWVLSERKYDLAIDIGKLACPASGAVEWRERNMWDDWSVMGWFGTSIIIECAQELGIWIDSSYLTYLGVYRELIRLGKPQVFYLIDMKDSGNGLTVEQIDASWHIYATDHEFEDIVFKNNKEVFALLDNNDSLCSHELQMNLALALDHLGIYE